MAAMDDATEPDEPLDPVYVLIIDDQDDAGVWDHRFAEDARLRRMQGATTAFMRYARPCRTAAQARTAIEGAVRDDVPLSLIFVDNKLQLTAVGYETREEAIGLMLFIAAQYEDRPRPPCVLATAEPDTLLSYAFMAAGGTHCFDKKARTQFVLTELWRVIEHDERWRPRFQEPRLELTKAQASILPYLYAGLAPHEIVRRMKAAGELAPDRTDHWVHTRTAEIYRRANEVLDATATLRPEGEPRPFGQGDQQRVARIALEHGNHWIDMRFRDLLAERLPRPRRQRTSGERAGGCSRTTGARASSTARRTRTRRRVLAAIPGSGTGTRASRQWRAGGSTRQVPGASSNRCWPPPDRTASSATRSSGARPCAACAGSSTPCGRRTTR
jgi:hypothetical protein